MQIEINLAPAWAWTDPTIPHPSYDDHPSALELQRAVWLVLITDPTNGDTYMRMFRNSQQPDAEAIMALWKHRPQLFLHTPNPNTDNVLPS